MATFNDATVGTSTGGTTPDFGASRKSQPNVRKVQFGDGYEQRLTYGLNQNPRVWDLTWTAKDSTDADAIEAFLMHALLTTPALIGRHWMKQRPTNGL